MKKAVLAWTIGLLFAMSGAAWAQMPAETAAPDQLRTLTREELDVVKVLTAQERAWNRGDMDAYASGYKDSPDLLFVGKQVSRGYAALVDDYKHNYPTREAMGTLAFSELEPHVLDDRFAVLLGHYHLDRSKKSGGAADGIFSLVLEKTDKGWKIVVDHTT
jgi:ketosteroid isomerase-like protein